MTREPVLFVSHGAPTVALERDAFTAALARFGAANPAPRAILVVSAHWVTRGGVALTGAARHEVVHDFGGFPDALYALDYPAPGAPAVAARAAELLRAAGVDARVDPDRKLDHGAWVPLRLAWPAADVPVVEMSLPAAPPDVLLRVGAALAPLREEGVLLVASGGAIHNLGEVRLGEEGAAPDDWARTFDAWLAARLDPLDVDGLARWHEEAPEARRAAPTSEHFDPLLVAVGARAPGERVETLFDAIRHGNLSLRSFVLR